MKIRVIPVLMLVMFLAACAAKVRPESAARATPSAEEAEGDPYYRFIRSDLLAMEGQTGKSTRELELLAKQDPHIAYTWLLLAQNYANERRFDDAIASTQRAIEIEPSMLEARLFLAKLYIADNRNDEAIATLEDVLARNPHNEQIYMLLAREYVQRKDFNRAIATLTRLIQINPDMVGAYYYLGSIYMAQKRDDRALAAYRDGLKIDPDSVTLLAATAQMYLERRQFAKALELFERIETLDPEDVSVQLRVALIRYQLKDYDGAVEKFSQILEANPDADKIRFYLGIMYENVGRANEAIAEFENVPPYSTYYAQARLRAAMLYRKQGRNAEAVASMHRAIEAREQMPELHKYLAALLEEDHDYRGAADALLEGARLFPGEEDFHFLLGVIYEKLKDRERAHSSMKRALKINPDNPSALNYVGYTYAERNEHLDEAEEMVRKALTLKPGSAYITDSLGWVMFKKGALDDALTYIRDAARLLPDEPTILYHLGRVKEALGDHAGARAAYERALQLARTKSERDDEEIAEIEKHLQGLGAAKAP